MDIFFHTVSSWRARLWQWFVHHAHGPYALRWLALIGFSDTIISPLAPELFLVALMLAHPARWKQYLSVAILSSTAGAVIGFYLARFVFHQFGEPVLAFYHLNGAFVQMRHLLVGRVFLGMMFASFTPLPDKAFIYAAGFLNVHFIPFIFGFFLGRLARMAVLCYVVGRYGKHVLERLNTYLLWLGALLFIAALIWGIVHFGGASLSLPL